jgi:diguanylate cyclase (GGDEF)-like protein
VPRSGVGVLVALLVAALIIPLPFVDEPNAHLVYIVAECFAMVASWIFWLVRRPIAAKAWFVLLLGCSITAVPDVLQYGVHHRGLLPEITGPAQVVNSVGFVVMASAALMFCAHRVERGTRALLLDTGVLTAGLATPLFALRVLPNAGSALDRVSVVGYATVSLLSLALGSRFVMAWRAAGSPWLLWLAGGALANGAASLLAADAPLASDPQLDVCRTLWIAAHALGFAAMVMAVPTNREARAPVTIERPSPTWVAVLVLSLAMPGVTLAIAESLGHEVSLPVIAAGSVALAVLVSARMATLVAHLHGQSLKLSEVAVSDELTGIPNRRGWNQALSQACRLAEWNNQWFSLAVLDLDHFKMYNDRFGHQAGDDLLAATARTWRQILPADAILARYGGEEFALLLFVDNVAATARVLAAMRSVMPHGQTFSAGLTLWRPGVRAELLFAEADDALYRAKGNGRDRSEVSAEAAIVLPKAPVRLDPVYADDLSRSARRAASAQTAVAYAVDRRVASTEYEPVLSARRTKRAERQRLDATSDLAG